MTKNLILFVFLFYPIVGVSQLTKGTLLVSDNFSFLYSGETIEARFRFSFQNDRGKRFDFNTPTFDYFLAKKISIGGKLNYALFKIFDKNFKRFELLPHLKYWADFKRIDVFLSMSSLYFNQKNDFALFTKRKVNELSFYAGMGAEIKISPGLTLEFWLQSPIFNANHPFREKRSTVLISDSFSSINFRWNLTTKTDFDFKYHLMEFYLNKNNFRFGLSFSDFRNFETKEATRSKTVADMEYFIGHKYSIYTTVYFSRTNKVGILESNFTAKEGIIGVKGWINIYDELKLNWKWGFVVTNSDYSYFYGLGNSIGVETGFEFLLISENRLIWKGGVEIQTTDFDKSFLFTRNFSLFVGPEYFLNEKLSIEPKMGLSLLQARVNGNSSSVRNFDGNEWNYIFELKLKTLFVAKKWLE